MKIAFVSDDQKTVAAHFGQAQGFLIVEVKDGEEVNREYRLSNFSDLPAASRGGQGGKLPYILQLLPDCEMIVAGGMGNRAFSGLQETGKTVVMTQESSIEILINQCKAGEINGVDGYQPCAGKESHDHQSCH